MLRARANRKGSRDFDTLLRLLLMQPFFRLFLLLALSCAPAFAQRNLGTVEVAVDNNVLPVRVSSSTPELNDLALRAFNLHGRYRLVSSNYAFDIVFTAVGPTQVRVDVTKARSVALDAEYVNGRKPGGARPAPAAPATPMFSETVSGSSLRVALLRAADRAVEQTNGLGLHGFFTARLAFIRDMGKAKEVCTSDLLFSSGEVKYITRNNTQALSPRWAPDGTKILFTSYLKGFPDVYVLDLVSSRWVTFANYKGSNYGARFSPSGRQVAMVLTAEGSPDIYVSDAQGKGPARRTHSDQAKGSPCWKPDGSQIVFSMQPGPQLYVMSAAGGTPQRLMTGFALADEPDWNRVSPNKLACTVRGGHGFQIAVYDFSKGQAEIVSKAAFDGIEPSWLADGRHLVYTARSTSESRLCVLDTETGKSTPISPASFGSAMQASVWTP
jgi:TolB protein